MFMLLFFFPIQQNYSDGGCQAPKWMKNILKNYMSSFLKPQDSFVVVCHIVLGHVEEVI